MSNKTLKDLLMEGVERFNDSDKPSAIIDKAIEELFVDSVASEFRSYSDFGKEVKDAIKAALPANIADVISLTKYNTLIVDSLKKQWESAGVEKDFINKANEALNEVINKQPIPEYIYLSDLLEAFVEEYAEEAMEDGWEYPDIRIEEEDKYRTKYCHIYFDKKPKKESSYLSSVLSSSERSKYSLDNSLACKILEYKIKGKDSYDYDEYDVYEVYSAKFEGECMGKLLQTNCNKYEHLMVALYCGSSKLVLDCDADDISYPNQYD